MRIISLLSAVLLFIFAGAIWSQDAGPEVREASKPTTESQDSGESKSPMMVEIDELLADEMQQVAELRAQVLETQNSRQRLDLIRAIHELKAETEIEMLRIQLKYARIKGKTAAIISLEEAIEFMTNPRPVPAPKVREQRSRPQSQGR